MNPDSDIPEFRKMLKEIPSLNKIMEESNEESSEEDDKANSGINVASKNISEAAFLYL